IQGTKLLYIAFDSTAQQFRIHRLNENGSLDNSFSSTLLSSLQIQRVKVQSDNRILILQDKRVFRLGENGGIDGTFQSPPNFPGYARQLFLQSDDRITITHANDSPPGEKVIRLLPNGTPDPSF